MMVAFEAYDCMGTPSTKYWKNTISNGTKQIGPM